jgi:hypothetical protein
MSPYDAVVGENVGAALASTKLEEPMAASNAAGETVKRACVPVVFKRTMPSAADAMRAPAYCEV